MWLFDKFKFSSRVNELNRMDTSTNRFDAAEKNLRLGNWDSLDGSSSNLFDELLK